MVLSLNNNCTFVLSDVFISSCFKSIDSFVRSIVFPSRTIVASPTRATTFATFAKIDVEKNKRVKKIILIGKVLILISL